MVLIGCTDGHVWWFLLPNTKNSYDLIVSTLAYQAEESEIIIRDRNENVSGTFPGKESHENATVISATSFGKFVSRIDDFVFVDLYPDVLYSSCITKSNNNDQNGNDIDDKRGNNGAGSGDNSGVSSANDHENVLLKNAAVTSKSNLNSTTQSESELRIQSSTHICVVSAGRVRIIGVCRVCDIIVGDEHTLSAHLFHDKNALYHSRGNYINGTYMGCSVSTVTVEHGYQYTGCYGDTVKQDIYGNYAFITVQDGILYASILIPFRATPLSGGDSIRQIKHGSNNERNNNDNSDSSELLNNKWYNSEVKVFLTHPYRLTSETCPFIYHCNILSHSVELEQDVEVEIEKSLKEGVEGHIDVSNDNNISSMNKREVVDTNSIEKENKGATGNGDNDGNKDDNESSIKCLSNDIQDSRNGLDLHFIDDTTGVMKTQFLPTSLPTSSTSLQCTDDDPEDVLCLLRGMCGYQAVSISTSISSTVNKSSSAQENAGFNGSTRSTRSGYPNNNMNNSTSGSNNINTNKNCSNSSSSSNTSRNSNRAQTDIHRITSALDKAVETERILAQEIQTVDLEILQLVSLISLIENDALASRCVILACHKYARTFINSSLYSFTSIISFFLDDHTILQQPIEICFRSSQLISLSHSLTHSHCHCTSSNLVIVRQRTVSTSR